MNIWVEAARPKTLAAGVVPVAVGVALAGVSSWLAAAATLVGALLIQIGCNYANDAFDGLRGADAQRIGPRRAVAAGLVSPRAMLAAAGLVLALAFAVGLYLAAIGGWPILVLGLVSIVCAIAYTGGPLPLAYRGLGDLFVLLFFGFAAVVGAAWVQQPHLPLPGVWWWAGAAVGLQSTALICINNLRDIATDAPVGKRTLAVRLGDRGTRTYHALLHLAAAVCWGSAAALRPELVAAAACAGLGGAVVATRVWQAQGAGLNDCLAAAARTLLITGVVAVAVIAWRSGAG